MTSRTLFRRLCQLVLALSSLVLSACPDLGLNNFSNCQFAPSPEWIAAGLQHFLSQPQRCPISVQGVGTPVQYAAAVQAPSYNIESANLTTDVYDALRDLQVSASNDWYSYSYGIYEVDIAFQYLAGSHRPPPPFASFFVDDAENATYSNYGYTTSHVSLTYRIGASASLSGPAYPTPGTSPTWTASVTNATPPSTYRWFKNGVELSGQTSSSLTLPVTSSYFSLKVIGQASAGGADTLEAQIVPSWALTIYGMSQLAPGVQCGYSVDTGTNPSGSFTYEWILDGAILPDQGSFTNPPLSSGSHTLEAFVTDANGYTAKTSFLINVTPGGPSNCV
jgi:hypothetical protein